MRVYLAVFIYCCLLTVAGSSFLLAAEKPVVFVSILPQKFFVHQIAGEIFDVEVMVKPGASPATYEPKPSQMAKLSSSAAYLAIGVPFENNWLDKFNSVNPSMNIVHTEQGITKISMAEHLHDAVDGDGHLEEHGREHGERAVLDPHVWLSPALVKKQTKIIFETLVEIMPEQSGLFDSNYQLFLDKLDALDDELRALFKGRENMKFMVFHPSWGYFAREYGLKQVAIEMEGKEPKPAQLLDLIRFAKDNGVQVIFAQRQFSAKKAKVVAREIGGRVVIVDPLAENWFANLRQVGRSIHAVVQ
ncbi:MAG: metal ABC transporter solute-binding protein, Zn/Mn family [Desulforhopalus sp.]